MGDTANLRQISYSIWPVLSHLIVARIFIPKFWTEDSKSSLTLDAQGALLVTILQTHIHPFTLKKFKGLRFFLGFKVRTLVGG